jgi:hypothetical protein
MMRKTFTDHTEEPLLGNDIEYKKSKCSNRCKFLTCCMLSSGLLMSIGFYYIYKIEEDGSEGGMIEFLPGVI